MTEPHVSALDALREERDKLRHSLMEDLRHYRGTVGETAYELDNELADVNHLAVAQGLEAVAGALRAADSPLDELGDLLAVRFPDEPPPPAPADHTPLPLPEAPVPVDPETLEIDEDDEMYRYDLMRERLQERDAGAAGLASEQIRLAEQWLASAAGAQPGD